ncbi:MAG: tetratricopeptide repeat protein [Ignavibacteriaceae bacterium]
MKNNNKIFVAILFVILFSTSKIYSNNFVSKPVDCDSLEVLKLYSLFSEYHKNKDFASALPYGWQVLECDAHKFRKWIYYKMEDCLWYLHDSTDVSLEMKESIEDTIIYLYDLAIEHYPEQKAYFESHKAFILEGWLEVPYEEVIAEYEKAIKDDAEISSYYYNRLGLLYIVNASDENDYKTKALDLYTYLQNREPDNPQWPQELVGLVDNIDQLVELRKKNWYNDKENLSKAWDFVQIAMKAENYPEAIEGLEFLIEKSPETVNYWNQLATAYQKTNQLKNAENALLKLIEIDPDAKEHYLNLGIVYGDMGKFSNARRYYIKASEIGGGWALPIYYEGSLYEKSARACNFDFETKKVYQLAVDTYKKAARMDASLTDAKNRIDALSSTVPTQEDFFFRGYKSGQILPIIGDCFSWIGKSVTVP